MAGFSTVVGVIDKTTSSSHYWRMKIFFCQQKEADRIGVNQMLTNAANKIDWPVISTTYNTLYKYYHSIKQFYYILILKYFLQPIFSSPKAHFYMKLKSQETETSVL